MKCVVDKKSLANAVNAIKKLNSKSQKVFIKVKKGLLSVITTNPIYVKYTLPVEDSEDGIVALLPDLFEKLLSARKSKLQLSVASNSLKVEGGSDLKIYCMDLGDEDLGITSDDSKKKITIVSTAVGDLKNIFSKVKFKSLESEDVFVILQNTENGFFIGSADDYHCAFYDSKSKLANSKFKIITKLNLLKDAISFIDGKALFEISDKHLNIKSDTLMISIPGAQSAEVSFDDAREHLEDKNFKKGYLVLDKSKFSEVLKSINIVGSGKDVLALTVKKDTVMLGLNSDFGKSKDSFKIKKNTMGDFEASIPILALQDSLDSLNGNKIEFRLAKEGNFYRLRTVDKKYSIRCVCPVASSR